MPLGQQMTNAKNYHAQSLIIIIIIIISISIIE